jgi:hypothetical protein
MKKDLSGETAKSIPGTVSNPKEQANHSNIPNTVNNAKDMTNQGLKNSILPPPKK